MTTLSRLVDHLIGMNRVFTALLADAPVPRASTGGQVNEDPVIAYHESAAALLRAFGQPGVLDRQYQGPLGTASGAERLQIRLYDLLAHGWDLAHATGQPVDLPDDLLEPSVAFTRVQLADQSRDGRFGPPQNVDAAPRPLSGWLPFWDARSPHRPDQIASNDSSGEPHRRGITTFIDAAYRQRRKQPDFGGSVSCVGDGACSPVSSSWVFQAWGSCGSLAGHHSTSEPIAPRVQSG